MINLTLNIEIKYPQIQKIQINNANKCLYIKFSKINNYYLDSIFFLISNNHFEKSNLLVLTNIDLNKDKWSKITIKKLSNEITILLLHIKNTTFSNLDIKNQNNLNIYIMFKWIIPLYNSENLYIYRSAPIKIKIHKNNDSYKINSINNYKNCYCNQQINTKINKLHNQYNNILNLDKYKCCTQNDLHFYFLLFKTLNKIKLQTKIHKVTNFKSIIKN